MAWLRTNKRERVQLAILKLSKGNEEKLRQCVVVAKRDYRDALLLAECAEEAKLDTPEKKAKSARVVREAWA